MIESVEEFIALVNDPDPLVRARLRESVAPTELWLMILESAPDQASLVAMNKTLPDEVLGWLVTHGDARARHLVAMKRKLPTNVLRQLAQDPDDGVRLAVAQRRNLSPEIVGMLRGDSWAAVRENADRRLLGDS